MLKLVLFNNHFYYHRSILYLNNVLFNVLEDSVTKLLASAAAAVAAHRWRLVEAKLQQALIARSSSYLKLDHIQLKQQGLF